MNMAGNRKQGAGNRKGQVAAEALIALAAFLVLVGAVVAGVRVLEEKEWGLKDAAGERMLAEEAASAINAGCWAGRVSAELPVSHRVSGERVGVGGSAGRVVQGCGGVGGEPI